MKARARVQAILRASILLALPCLAATHTPAEEWTDPLGDAVPPNVDILSGSVTVFEGMAEFRLRFAATPFPETRTHHVAWCMDTDRNAATGIACGAFPGSDAWVDLDGRPGAIATCNFVIAASRGTGVSTVEIDHYSSVWYDPASNTIRILIPLSVISDDPSFHYAVLQAVGGGGGENVPDSPNFSALGGFFSSDVGPFPAFAGSLLCTRETVPIDILPRNDRNIVNLRSHGRLAVAVLTTEAFDATTIFWSTALFGPTGTEAEPLDSTFEDADGDGHLDLVLFYDIDQTGIRCGDEAATLKAYGQARHGVQGTAPIRTVGCAARQTP